MAPVTAAPRRPLRFHEQLLAGAVAGVTELFIMYPLDVVKTRAQARTHGAGVGFARELADIVVKENVRAYRGILFPILAETPKRALKFTVSSRVNDALRASSSPLARGLSNQQKAIASGVAAGVLEATVVCAPELVKIRMQVPENKALYKSSVDCARSIVRDEGAASLFRGLCCTWMRNGSWNGCYFGSIPTIKASLQSAGYGGGGGDGGGAKVVNFVAGSIAGAIGTFVNTPFDVVKTRLQNNAALSHAALAQGDAAGAAAVAALPGRTLPYLAHIAAREGLGGLWKGFVPKVVRLGPGGGIMLVVFEAVGDYLASRG